MFETNPSFHMKQRRSGKSLISIFREFSSSIDKAFIFGGDWALGYHSVGLDTFMIFPKVLSCSATRAVTRTYHVYK